MMYPGGTGNRLLAALPPADFDLLTPELETVTLEQDTVLLQAGGRTEHVFFPHSGAITLMVDMANGQTVATALVGREGAIGSLSVLGPSPSAITAIVRMAGTASRLPASRFHAAFSRSPAIRYALQTHIRATLVQLQLGAACNALHPVKARMGRWMLHLRDHSDDDMLPLTQETLSQILGVRRTTVTLLMRSLRASGAIRSERRGQIEIDRPRLAAVACECHATMRREIEEIFSTRRSLSGTAAESAEIVHSPGG
ncbi:MAG TPA: Crp/Fnr family transcriptional regulator [Bradyrhizobium sp.]|nr:Crp/Fnr family transcriptional regulator [Bradyrhizobium sp.]